MYQAIYYDRSTYTFHLRDDKTGWSEFKYNRPRYVIDPNGSLFGKSECGLNNYLNYREYNP